MDNLGNINVDVNGKLFVNQFYEELKNSKVLFSNYMWATDHPLNIRDAKWVLIDVSSEKERLEQIHGLVEEVNEYHRTVSKDDCDYMGNCDFFRDIINRVLNYEVVGDEVFSVEYWKKEVDECVESENV